MIVVALQNICLQTGLPLYPATSHTNTDTEDSTDKPQLPVALEAGKTKFKSQCPQCIWRCTPYRRDRLQVSFPLPAGSACADVDRTWLSTSPTDAMPVLSVVTP